MDFPLQYHIFAVKSPSITQSLGFQENALKRGKPIGFFVMKLLAQLMLTF